MVENPRSAQEVLARVEALRQKPEAPPPRQEVAGMDERRERIVAEVAKKFADDLSRDILQKIQTVFEQNADTKERLPYHDTDHTRMVIDRTEKILRAMQVDGKDMQIGRIAASAHDVVQISTQNPETGVRVRATGKNEAMSIELIQAMMQKANTEHGFEIFSAGDTEHIRSAIEATVPGWVIFGEATYIDEDEEDPNKREKVEKKGTVVQPNLHHDSSPIARAVALSDLGDPGLDPRAFLQGGDDLFREMNPGMVDLDPTMLSEEQKTQYKKSMRVWNRSQKYFAEGRKLQFEKELGDLPEPAKIEVRKLFTEFDSSIAAAEVRSQLRATMTFDQLYESMGFQKSQDRQAA